MRIPAFFGRRYAPCDILAAAVLTALAIIALLTFDDYGLGWDDYTHSQYGEMLYSYYASGFTDLRAFSFVNLFYYGGGFDIVATILGKILPLNLFDTRRLLGAFVGLIGLAITWRTARRVGGPVAGVAALVLLAICPLYYGHMYINAKDAPFAVAMIFLIYSLVRAFDEYPRPRVSTVLLFGLALGCTIGTRIIGGIVVVFAGIGFLFLLAAEWRRTGWRETLHRALGFSGKMAFGLPIAYALMGLIWPWSIRSPLNPVYAIEYFSHFWEIPWKELFDGVAILIPNMPRSYLPKLCVLKFPEIFLLLSFAGIVGAIYASVRGTVNPERRASLMLLVSAAVLPVLLAVITKPVLYNGIRHFLFITPPLAVLGGLAAGYIYEQAKAEGVSYLRGAVAVFVVLVAWTAVDLVRIHPYQYALFNHVAGGMKSASQRYMTDYWGLGIKETVGAMIEQLEESHATPPPGRKWRVAVCGPAHSAAVELGPNFVTTYNAKGADFAISLGTFYCAQLDAPVMAESEREGVVFARAYDLRDRTYATTYSYPPAPPKQRPISTAERQINTFWH